MARQENIDFFNFNFYDNLWNELYDYKMIIKDFFFMDYDFSIG